MKAPLALIAVCCTMAAAPLSSAGEGTNNTATANTTIPTPPVCDQTCQVKQERNRLEKRFTPHGHWAIPSYIVMCESHGNPRDVNPASGAGGAYQDLPSTWQSTMRSVPARVKRQLVMVGARLKARAELTNLLGQHVVNFYLSDGGHHFGPWSCA